MRVTDRLIEDAKQKKKQQKTIETEEETLTYAQKKKRSDINQEMGVFGSVMGDGINTRKSIFDKTAIFQVEEH